MTRKTISAISILALAALLPVPTSAADGQIGLDRAMFVTTPKWYQLGNNLREDDILIFRRYAISVIDGKIGTDIGNVKNIYDFGCQRSAKHNDYVVFHFPEWIDLKGVARSDWIPKMSLNFALNERKNTFDAQGEFKNGALFIDLDDFTRDNLLRLVAADETIVQMPSGDRLNVLQRTRTPDGKGDIASFVDDVVPMISKAVNGGAVRSMETVEVFKRCQNYKRTGRY
jgi:hypothetical protein